MLKLMLVTLACVLLAALPLALGVQIRIVLCNSQQGCGTDDGYLVDCGGNNFTQGVAIMKTIEDGESYIIVQRMDLPSDALSVSLDPDDSPVQMALPTVPPAPVELEEGAVPDAILQLARCFRIPPALFRAGRYFPFVPIRQRCVPTLV